MDYLRTGANAWAGYGLLFYARQANDVQFTNTLTRLADYILTQQVRDHSATSPTQDLRYGLFKGGYGRWTDQEFYDEAIQWVAAEHNIDAYFFLRDMGQWTGEPRYVEAAERLRAHMDTLWDEEKGRLNQAMDLTGTLNVLNTGDALDAASWGAMYWLAVSDRERARRSLAYADAAYRNTVTVSSTLSIWGYKPYHGFTESFDWSTATVVWSEGSLGVAMASLKFGRALLACGDPAGEAYVDQARAIVTEMQKLQDLDPQGGLLYAQSAGAGVPDFPAAPSAAGTTWLLMVQAALEDEELCDAFWSADPDLIRCVTLSGPATGQIDTAYTFSATVQSLSATLPVTYHWRGTGQLPVTHTGRLSSTATGPWSLSDSVVMRWETDGLKRITVTVRNARNAVDATHTVLISPGKVYLPLVLKH